MVVASPLGVGSRSGWDRSTYGQEEAEDGGGGGGALRSAVSPRPAKRAAWWRRSTRVPLCRPPRPKRGEPATTAPIASASVARPVRRPAPCRPHLANRPRPCSPPPGRAWAAGCARALPSLRHGAAPPRLRLRRPGSSASSLGRAASPPAARRLASRRIVDSVHPSRRSPTLLCSPARLSSCARIARPPRLFPSRLASSAACIVPSERRRGK